MRKNRNRIAQVLSFLYPITIETNQLKLYNQDVLTFLQNNQVQYDYIFVDVFDNLNEPENLLSE